MALLAGLLLSAWAAPALAEGLAVVLQPKTSGDLTKEEQARMEGAVSEALRSAQLQDVPAADREAILDGEPELRGCISDECQDRVGRLLGAQSVLTETWDLVRGEPPPAPAAQPAPVKAAPVKAGKGKKAAPPPPPPVTAQAPAPAPGTWRFSVALFNVQIGAVGAKEMVSCDGCDLDQAAQALSELVKKVVLLDAARPRGTIEVMSTPSADVLVDGRKLGFTPYRRAAFVGKHDITVARTGYKTVHTTIEVEEGKKAPVDVKLAAGKDKEFISVRGPRAKWRIGTGLAAIGAGVALIGVGAWLLSTNGQCETGAISQPPCDVSARHLRPDGTITYNVVDHRGGGIGTIVPGAALAIVGALLIGLPGEKQLVQVSSGMVGGGYGLRIAGSF